jgi:hypothetical protein
LNRLIYNNLSNFEKIIFSDGNFVEKNKRLCVFVQKGSNVTEVYVYSTRSEKGGTAFSCNAFTLSIHEMGVLKCALGTTTHHAS